MTTRWTAQRPLRIGLSRFIGLKRLYESLEQIHNSINTIHEANSTRQGTKTKIGEIGRCVQTRLASRDQGCDQDSTWSSLIVQLPLWITEHIRGNFSRNWDIFHNSWNVIPGNAMQMVAFYAYYALPRSIQPRALYLQQLQYTLLELLPLIRDIFVKGFSISDVQAINFSLTLTGLGQGWKL